jgi:uncharacterized NAD(P)/FAD-binding protein YdhS
MSTNWISAMIVRLSPHKSAWRFDVFIDARGQKPLKTKDLPFPTLRKQLQATGDEIPDVGEDYTLKAPESLCGRVALWRDTVAHARSALCSGLAECARWEAMAKAAEKPASVTRNYLFVRTDGASLP